MVVAMVFLIINPRSVPVVWDQSTVHRCLGWDYSCYQSVLAVILSSCSAQAALNAAVLIHLIAGVQVVERLREYDSRGRGRGGFQQRQLPPGQPPFAAPIDAMGAPGPNRQRIPPFQEGRGEEPMQREICKLRPPCQSALR